MYSQNSRINLYEVEQYRLPVYHNKGKERYVYFYVLDPSSVANGCPQLKRIRKKFNRYPTKRACDEAAIRFCHEVAFKLKQGWNPLIEKTTQLGFVELNTIFDRYLTYIKKQLQDEVIKKSTYQNYSSRMTQLRDWLESMNGIIIYAYQFTRVILEQFLEHIYLDGDTTSKTRNNYLNWLQSLCNWMVSVGYIETNPAEHIKKLREKDKFRKSISQSDMAKLSDYLLDRDKHYLLACYMLYYTLIRPNEMSYLRIRDFCLKEQTVFVSHEYSKNRKDASVTVPAKVIKLMLDLDIFSYPGEFYLFGTQCRPSAEYCSGKQFRDRWLSVRKALGFPKEYQFYSLKDSGITDAIDRVGLTVTKDQARHSNVATTNKYVRKEQHKAHPELKNYEGNL